MTTTTGRSSSSLCSCAESRRRESRSPQGSSAPVLLAYGSLLALQATVMWGIWPPGPDRRRHRLLFRLRASSHGSCRPFGWARSFSCRLATAPSDGDGERSLAAGRAARGCARGLGLVSTPAQLTLAQVRGPGAEGEIRRLCGSTRGEWHRQEHRGVKIAEEAPIGCAEDVS